MKTETFQSLTVQGVEHGKDINFQAEYRRFKEYLNENTATCTMVCEAIDIRQKNATRYKRELEDNGQLIEVFTAKCKFTGYSASYLTTNQNLIKSLKRERTNQLTLFK